MCVCVCVRACVRACVRVCVASDVGFLGSISICNSILYYITLTNIKRHIKLFGWGAIYEISYYYLLILFTNTIN